MFPNDTRILIVDDMNMMRTFIKSQLRQLGFTNFSEAADGAKALKIIEDNSMSPAKSIQLIFADWDMPVMSGIELLANLKKNIIFKHIPFILVTAEGEPHKVKEAIAMGVSNFVRKPFSPAILSEKIEAVWHAKNKKAA